MDHNLHQVQKQRGAPVFGLHVYQVRPLVSVCLGDSRILIRFALGSECGGSAGAAFRGTISKAELTSCARGKAPRGMV